MSGAIARSARELGAAGAESGRLDATRLLGAVLGHPVAWLIAHSDNALTEEQERRFRALCDKRAEGMPVAYLTGFAGFYGREFAVGEAVLVPRPETEHLVDDAVAYLRTLNDSPVRVLDAGTGSGAIACTIAAEVTRARVDATDISEAALNVARKNAQRLRVDDRCAFILADIASVAEPSAYDVVIANLPYVPSADLAPKPDPTAFEPRIALDGGPDGLRVYRGLVARAGALLAPGGLLLMEAAPPTIGALAALAAAEVCVADVEVCRDYGGRDRYVRANGARPTLPE